MKEIALFLLFLPAYVVLWVVGGVMIVVLFLFAVPYVLAKLIWAAATGRDLGPGW